jgi:hypothetical protein
MESAQRTQIERSEGGKLGIHPPQFLSFSISFFLCVPGVLCGSLK